MESSSDDAAAYRCVQCWSPCCDTLCPAAIGFAMPGRVAIPAGLVQKQLCSLAKRPEDGESHNSPSSCKLPQDVLLLVFGQLRIMDLLHASRVSVYWRHVSLRPSLWVHLDLMHSGCVTLRRVHAMAPSCRSLALRGDHCWRHDQMTLRVLCAWGGLQSLTLCEARLPAGALTLIARALPALHTLRLRANSDWFFSDGCLASLPAACPHITHLGLFQPPGDEGRSLELLHRDGWEPLTAMSLYRLADSSLAAGLREVHIGGFHLLPPPKDYSLSAAWAYVFSRCPSIEIVDVNVPMRLELDEANSMDDDLLYFDHESFIDAVRTHLAGSCRALNLHYFDEAPAACIGRLRQMSQLTHLDVRRCATLGDEILTDLLRGCERLLHLGLTSVGAAHLEGTLANAALLPRLRTLCVCELDADASAAAVQGAILLGDLRRLNIGHGDSCATLTLAQLVALSRRCPQLEHARFDCDLGVADGPDDKQGGLSAALRLIRVGWPRLTHLEIECYGVGTCSQEDLLELAHAIPRMRHAQIQVSAISGDAMMPWAAFVLALAWKWRELTFLCVGRSQEQRRAYAANRYADKLSDHEKRELFARVRRACPDLAHFDCTAASPSFVGVSEQCICGEERWDGPGPDSKPFRLSSLAPGWRQAVLQRAPSGEVCLGSYQRVSDDGTFCEQSVPAGSG
jgi:hypothetical protein